MPSIFPSIKVNKGENELVIRMEINININGVPVEQANQIKEQVPFFIKKELESFIPNFSGNSELIDFGEETKED